MTVPGIRVVYRILDVPETFLRVSIPNASHIDNAVCTAAPYAGVVVHWFGIHLTRSNFDPVVVAWAGAFLCFWHLIKSIEQGKSPACIFRNKNRFKIKREFAIVGVILSRS